MIPFRYSHESISKFVADGELLPVPESERRAVLDGTWWKEAPAPAAKPKTAGEWAVELAAAIKQRDEARAAGSKRIDAVLAEIRATPHNGRIYQQDDARYMLAHAQKLELGFASFNPRWFYDQCRLISNTVARMSAMEAALARLIAEPHGCIFCDSGKLRNPAKNHAPDCGYAMAQAITARDAERGAKA